MKEMKLHDTAMLKRLGAGDSIQSVCDAAGITREAFDRWWKQSIEARVPPKSGSLPAGVESAVTIQRDPWGIPHIYAERDTDLFFGFGYAMAQDRLFQLDWLRRKGRGRLSEILGPEGLPLDSISRTVGINRIAAAEWHRLAPDVQQLVQAFCDGVNAFIEQCGDRLPIEFDLLDYRPEPWKPVDCLAIENEFRWYLTGRFPVLVIPELAKRTLGEGPLYEAFLRGEADEESIIQPGEYTPAAIATRGKLEPVGRSVNDPDAAIGSNNWVIAGSRTTTGFPLLGSDPHIAFEAVSCWYEVHLCGGSFHVAGMAYTGIPAVMFGRNERVAWGITNNICSQRDLYLERTDPNHPGCFLFDGQWEPARQLVETIQVRGAEPVVKTIRFSRNGPVVDEILPPPSGRLGAITLKWLGAYQGGWLTALLAMDRADDVAQFREATRPWHVPTFSLVIADENGTIAYQSGGRIPIRRTYERGCRPGWDPQHQWQGLIPFEGMPQVVDPPRGWVASANNRPAPDDYPFPLSGCWSSGWRAVRIRRMIESRARLSAEDMREMHQDCASLRAAELVPAMLSALDGSPDEAAALAALDQLKNWDYRVEPESVGGAIFNVFFGLWCRKVAQARFDAESVELISTGLQGIAGTLLHSDPECWFEEGDRLQRMKQAFAETLSLLTQSLGPDVSQWHWGRLHRMPLKHVLSSRGELGKLLDHGGSGVRGDMGTVCNTGLGPDWTATSGAGYRLIADFGNSPPALRAIDAQSQSGNPGSPHYTDQFADWLAGNYHEIRLDRSPAAGANMDQLVLEPFS